MDMPVLADQQDPYLHQPYADTGCSLDNLAGATDDRDGWRERERERERERKIYAVSVTKRFFYSYINHIYMRIRLWCRSYCCRK